MAYFFRTGATTFRASPHVGGAWRTDEQHVAPALGLLAHVVETDRVARGRDDLAVSRLAYDIWGVFAIGDVETRVCVVRPGRGVELVEATLWCAGRCAVSLRAWLVRTGDTAELAGGAPAPVPGPQQTPPWDPANVWPGGFIDSIEVRRTAVAPGRTTVWVRTDVPLVADEEVGALAGTAGLLDAANGMAVRADPREVAFPNVDLTAHLFRAPLGGWVGLDTTVVFGAAGTGVTHATLHDEDGPFGTLAQSLVVRSRVPGEGAAPTGA
ncbi:thioesterase family protein [Cellulosimicrobium cellulans]|uniref:thioesterase family protein n=1 Tax=Cellulosimicrobium cellulans TaxID=1710 RepID=UPI001963FB84|nr:thioesterase family protein [Cellulosimicrobium cellulans]MBN0038744.1 thioesterase family protein [Cellulosimicrobium cellulans]